MAKIKKILDLKPINLFKILLLTASLFLAFYIGDKSINLSSLNPLYMFIFWYAVIFITQTLINFALGKNGK